MPTASIQPRPSCHLRNVRLVGQARQHEPTGWLAQRSVVLRDIGDRPDFALFLPLAHQVGKGNDTVLAKRGDEAPGTHAWGMAVPRLLRALPRNPIVERDHQSFRVRDGPMDWHRESGGPGDGALISESTLGPLFDCTAILVSGWTLEPCGPDNTSQILTLAALCFSLFGIDPSPDKTVDRPCLGLTRLGR